MGAFARSLRPLAVLTCVLAVGSGSVAVARQAQARTASGSSPVTADAHAAGGPVSARTYIGDICSAVTPLATAELDAVLSLTKKALTGKSSSPGASFKSAMTPLLARLPTLASKGASQLEAVGYPKMQGGQTLANALVTDLKGAGSQFTKAGAVLTALPATATTSQLAAAAKQISGALSAATAYTSPAHAGTKLISTLLSTAGVSGSKLSSVSPKCAGATFSS
jgi:hypothetical protein